jgi:hypothetical protein
MHCIDSTRESPASMRDFSDPSDPADPASTRVSVQRAQADVPVPMGVLADTAASLPGSANQQRCGFNKPHVRRLRRLRRPSLTLRRLEQIRQTGALSQRDDARAKAISRAKRRHFGSAVRLVV